MGSKLHFWFDERVFNVSWIELLYLRFCRVGSDFFVKVLSSWKNPWLRSLLVLKRTYWFSISAETVSSSMLFNLVQGKRESLSPLKLLLIAGISCRTTTVDYATLEFPKIVHGILSCFKYSCRLLENIKIVHDFYYWMLCPLFSMWPQFIAWLLELISSKWVYCSWVMNGRPLHKGIRYYVELNANCSQLWIMDGSVYKPNDLVRTWEYRTYYF